MLVRLARQQTLQHLLLQHSRPSYRILPFSHHLSTPIARFITTTHRLLAIPKPPIMADAEPLTDSTVSELIPIIDSIFATSNLSAVTVKQVRTALSARTSNDFTPIKKQIDSIIKTRFDAILDAQQSTSPADAAMAAALDRTLNAPRPTRTAAPKPKRPVKRAAKKSAETVSDGEGTPKKKRKTNPNNAFMRPMVLGGALAEFIGEKMMSRTGVVKRCWDYIKANNLQDPGDRRYIMCDEKMKGVFGDRVHMFTMNKVLNGFMKKPDDVEGGLEMEAEWKREHPVEETAEVKSESAESEGVKSESESTPGVKSEE